MVRDFANISDGLPNKKGTADKDNDAKVRAAAAKKGEDYEAKLEQVENNTSDSAAQCNTQSDPKSTSSGSQPYE